MGLWETPVGSLALNVAASVLWDGGKVFVGRARGVVADRRATERLIEAVESRAGVLVDSDTLKDWLSNDEFWVLLAESARDRTAGLSAAESFWVGYLPHHSVEVSAKVLSVVLIETSCGDDELRSRLRQARLENKLDALEVGLGYVLEETLGASLHLESVVHRRLNDVGEQLSEVLNRLPGLGADSGLERDLREIVALVEQGTLMREAGIQLQVLLYREARQQ